MRSLLGKETRKLFRKMMATVFPEFREDKGQVVPPGWYVWTHQHASGLWLHILLVLNPTRDQFTVEAAWSTDSKIRSSCLNRPEEFLVDRGRIRFGFLWVGEDFWWRLFPNPERKRSIGEKVDPIEQCLPLVAPAVWEAGEKLKDHVVPIFEQIIQKHGKCPAA